MANSKGIKVKHWVGLAAVAIAVCLVGNAAISQTNGTESNVETGKEGAQTGLHVANPNISEFRKWLRFRSPAGIGVGKQLPECNAGRSAGRFATCDASGGYSFIG